MDVANCSLEYDEKQLDWMSRIHMFYFFARFFRFSSFLLNVEAIK